MYTRTYDVDYRQNKEWKEGELEIDLLKYHESFEENEFHLQQNYDDKTIKEYTRHEKVDFIEEEVKNQLKGRMNKRDIYKLIKELDEDLADIEEEF